VYRFVRSAPEVKKIVELAKERDALVVFTVMLPQINEVLWVKLLTVTSGCIP